MTTTSDTQGQVEKFDAALAEAAATPAAAPEDTSMPIRSASRKSVLAFALCALAINGAAAIYTSPYTLPSDFPALNVASLAELFPQREAPAPKPDPVVVALKEIQSTQQQHTTSLQESNQALQQNAALLQQDSLVLLSLRQSITEERVDVRKISSQLSTLIAKVDSLQNTVTSDVTSSIRRSHARYGLSPAMRKRIERQSKPVGPVSVGPMSVGGAPLSAPATVAVPDS